MSSVPWAYPLWLTALSSPVAARFCLGVGLEGIRKWTNRSRVSWH